MLTRLWSEVWLGFRTVFMHYKSEALKHSIWFEKNLDWEWSSSKGQTSIFANDGILSTVRDWTCPDGKKLCKTDGKENRRFQIQSADLYKKIVQHVIIVI